MEDDVLEVIAAPAESERLPNGWRGVIAGLDIETGDGRFLATPPGGIRTREYPLSLTMNHVGDGDAPVIGSVDRVWTQDGMLYGEGKIDLGGDDGSNFARQLLEGYINTVSIHPDLVTAEMQFIDGNGRVVPMDEAENRIVANDYELPEGWSTRVAFTDWRLAGLAVVPIPAYTEARIEGVQDYMGPSDHLTDALVATVGGQVFHAEFFTDPNLSEPTPLTVTEDGRVYGHVALWESCYQYGGGASAYATCQKPPHSATGYSRFHVHKANLGGGERIDVGVLTYGDGHISKGQLRASQEHLTHVATQAAKVVAGEDQFGVWVSGEVLDAARDFAHDIMDSPLSGHWEPDADAVGNLEMIGAHVVNTPGYAIRQPILASLGDGVNLDHLAITTRIKRAIADKTDDLADLAGIIADAVIVKMALREDEARAEAARKMKQVHAASVVARIQSDERNQRAAALAARLGI